MLHFTSDGLSIAYEVRGDHSLPPIVLLHGLATDRRMWHQAACALAPEYRVITMDLRGHGHSSVPEDPAAYTLDRLAGDVAALAEHLGLDVIALGGWEAGGAVALQLAATVPGRIAALALFDAAPAPARPDVPPGDLDLARRYGTHMLGRRRSREMATPFLQDALARTYAAVPTDGLILTADAWRAQAPPLPPSPMPLLLVCSGGSPLAGDVAALADARPGARFVTVRDAGGMAPVYRADATARILRGFLRDVEESRPTAGSWQV